MAFPGKPTYGTATFLDKRDPGLIDLEDIDVEREKRVDADLARFREKKARAAKRKSRAKYKMGPKIRSLDRLWKEIGTGGGLLFVSYATPRHPCPIRWHARPTHAGWLQSFPFRSLAWMAKTGRIRLAIKKEE